MACKISDCTRGAFIRCSRCRAEVCSDHEEDCEGCGGTFCPTCYRQHKCEEQALPAAA